MCEIKNLKPECVWRNFYDLTRVPRPSGHLDAVKKFLLEFAQRVGVEAFEDDANNIIMRKPATPGMENRKTVMIQAHMDMVPQKSKDSNHNFLTDPIETWIDGEWVKAKNTTLGADDGLGVAAIMAVMEDKEMKHGPIEGLITADEETGMFGANDLKPGILHSDILLNLDSETWGKMVVGSAGGIDIDANREYKIQPMCSCATVMKVRLKGLKGGHSGLEINVGRGNANKLMVRFVKEAIAMGARLCEWHGGNMRNAIPFECEVIMAMPHDKVEDFKKKVAEYEAMFISEYKCIEEGIKFFTEPAEVAGAMVEEDQNFIVNAINGVHNGVLRMIPSFPDVVETSSNLSIVDIAEGKASIKILARGARYSTKMGLAEQIKSTLNLGGFDVKFSGEYGGWDPNTDSEILNLMKRLYKELFHEEAITQVDHAGLECSVILSKYPGLDIVSVGPTIRSPHTTSERALIETVEPFWQLLKKTLEEVPVK